MKKEEVRKKKGKQTTVFFGLTAFLLVYLLEVGIIPAILSKGDPIYLMFWKEQFILPLIITAVINLLFVVFYRDAFAGIFKKKVDKGTEYELEPSINWSLGDRFHKFFHRVNAVAWYVDDGKLELLPAEISDDKLTCRIPTKGIACTLYSSLNEKGEQEPLPFSRRFYYQDNDGNVWPVVVVDSKSQTENVTWIGMDTGAFKPVSVAAITDGRAARSAADQKEDITMAVSFGLIMGYMGLVLGPELDISENPTAMLITTIAVMCGIMLALALSKK